MGSKTATQSRNAKRQADTAALMEAIRTGGEISKKREAELQKAADYGRGIQFIEGSPTVKGLTQKGGKPVFRTGATAEDYTGRIVASAPTLSELAGDASRALFGGTADKQVFTLPTSRPGTPTMDFANMVPDPQPTEGILPAVVEKFLVPGGITMSIAKDLFEKLFLTQEEDESDFQSLVPRDISVTTMDGEPFQREGSIEGSISIIPGSTQVFTYPTLLADGGLTDTVPPKEGPMSAGVASLFKNK